MARRVETMGEHLERPSSEMRVLAHEDIVEGVRDIREGQMLRIRKIANRANVTQFSSSVRISSISKAIHTNFRCHEDARSTNVRCFDKVHVLRF